MVNEVYTCLWDMVISRLSTKRGWRQYAILEVGRVQEEIDNDMMKRSRADPSSDSYQLDCNDGTDEQRKF
jgi:hypothetical protein